MGNMVMCPMLGLGGSFNLVGAALSDSPKSRVHGQARTPYSSQVMLAAACRKQTACEQ